METERWRAHRTTRPDPIAVAGAGALVLAVAAGWSDPLLLVLGRVVPGWAVGGVLLLGALVLFRTAAARNPPGAGRAVPRRVARGVLTTGAALGCALGALGELGADYHVLSPTGPGGCTAVVREEAFLLAGSGEVYAVGPSGIAWGPSGSWRTDDGYRPVARGTYELSWGPSDGALLVMGSSVDPVMDGLHGVDCG
ncbi:hypothetical protein [Streptomyces termitum]|uniref:hypothetical protein n=1 Tax=Streptomyces termitum TaxID=67368 RepID=UPI0037920794